MRLCSDPTPVDTSTHAVLATLFRRFARDECPPGGLYERLCHVAAGAPQVLDLLGPARPEQRRPNLLLAAVHDRLLAGDGHGLSAYFESVGGTRRVDAALDATFLDFCTQRRDHLLQCIGTHTTQTNEIGRCAVLWPVLRHVAARRGRTSIALLDVGCSAGLNLGVDAYSYEYGEHALGPGHHPGTPRIRCRLVGPTRPPFGSETDPRIVERLGIDPAPVAVDDAVAVRWLRACLWPHDVARRSRFDEAVALAVARRWPVRRVDDCTAAVAPWVAALPPDVLPVIFNSWVLTYLPPEALARHVAAMDTLVRERGAVWISAEGPALSIGDVEVPPHAAVASPEQQTGTRWIVAGADPGKPRYVLLARSHPHGTWLEWLDADRGSNRS